MMHFLWVCTKAGIMCGLTYYLAIVIPTQCEYFISEYEDDIVLLFQDRLSQKELELELCYDITGEDILILLGVYHQCSYNVVINFKINIFHEFEEADNNITLHVLCAIDDHECIGPGYDFQSCTV